MVLLGRKLIANQDGLYRRAERVDWGMTVKTFLVAVRAGDEE